MSPGTKYHGGQDKKSNRYIPTRWDRLKLSEMVLRDLYDLVAI